MNRKELPVFLDTNIVLDMLLEREPFYKPAASLVSLADKKQIHALVSSLTIANVNYVLAKRIGAIKSRRLLQETCAVLDIASVDERVVKKALFSDSEFKDVEDAIQHYCALAANASVIITRDKDYARSELPVMNAEEFLLWYSQN
jgi:predicted nucleic acid-binding protein